MSRKINFGTLKRIHIDFYSQIDQPRTTSNTYSKNMYLSLKGVLALAKSKLLAINQTISCVQVVPGNK